MNGELLNRLSERAGARYALLLEGFRHALVASSATPGWSDKARSNLLARCYALAEPYLLDEVATVGESVALMGQDAARGLAEAIGVLPPDLDDATEQHLSALVAELESLIRVQIERDIAATLGALRHSALTARLSARSTGSKRRGGSGAAPSIAAFLSFHYLDRASRRWPSERYVRAIWRHQLVLAWNEASMLLMADHGIVQALVAHPDPNHGEQGTLVSLDGRVPGLAWAELAETFHPNTQAYLVPNL